MSGITNFLGNGGIILALVLLAIAVATAIIFPIIQIVTNFGESKKSLAGVLGLAVVVAIGYALAGGTVPAYAVEQGISASQFKLIGALVNTAIIATTVVSAYIVIDLIVSIIRN
jgi:hypothetical protein